MQTSQRRDQHRPKELEGCLSRTGDTQILFKLFARELAQCPRFERTAEDTLARQTHLAWRQLVHTLVTHREHLERLLGPHLLPATYDTISESDLVRLLHQVRVWMDQTQSLQASSALDSTHDWLAHMYADVAAYRHYRDAMVRCNLRFVVLLARRHAQNPAMLLDLVQEGTLGLLRAIEKYDPDRGVRFATYAAWWIREAFARAVPSNDTASCSAAFPGDEDKGAVIDCIAAPEEATPEVQVLHAENRTHLYQALISLPEPEAAIIRLRFGLGEPCPSTLAEVGQRLGLTCKYVRIYEQRALVRLRIYLSRLTAASQQRLREPQHRCRKAA